VEHSFADNGLWSSLSCGSTNWIIVTVYCRTTFIITRLGIIDFSLWNPRRILKRTLSIGKSSDRAGLWGTARLYLQTCFFRYTLEMAKKAPHNECSWNYLLGWNFVVLQSTLNVLWFSVAEHANKSQTDAIWKFCEDLYDECKCKASHLLSFMVYFLDNGFLADAVSKKEPALKVNFPSMFQLINGVILNYIY